MNRASLNAADCRAGQGGRAMEKDHERRRTDLITRGDRACLFLVKSARTPVSEGRVRTSDDEIEHDWFPRIMEVSRG